jgi:hypothetical protein
MPLRSILLRVLLSIALVFNGAATAFASAGMDGMAEAAAAAEADVPPCHDLEQSSAPSTPEQGGHAGSDCCESGMCRCACLHHVPVALVALTFVAPVLVHPDSVRPMSVGHATPALPHLIRPPIG